MPEEHDRRLARRQPPVSGEVENYRRDQDEELDEGPSAEDIARFSDVTVRCANCGTEMFDDVALCWKCGHAVGVDAKGPTGTGVPVWAIAAAVVVVIAFVLLYVL
jgi:uncharacterized OB-fold protein